MNIPMKQYWDLLSRHIQPQRRRFSLLMILLVGNIALQVINPQIMRSFIDKALSGEAIQQILIPAILFISIALLHQAVSVAVTYLGENVAWTATNALRAELAWHCLNLDMSFHNTHTPGQLIERIDGDITEMSTFFSQFIITILGNFLLLVGILAALFREEWRVGLAFTLFSAIAMLLLVRVRELAVPHQKARREAEADMFGFIEEQLTGTEDVRSSGSVNFSLREVHRLQANIFKHDRTAHQKGWLIENLISILLTIGNIMAFGAGFLLYDAGAVTIGTAYLFIHYVNMLEQPITALTRQVQNLQTIGACVERLAELRKIQPKVIDGHANHIPQDALSLDFEDVCFAYDSDDPVIQDLSFQLQPGKVLGLLGRTGSGKTTVTRLVFRLYDPTQGYIRVAGRDLRETRLEALRQRVAVVTQDVQLFRASVRDNLTFFDREIPDDQILAAIEELGLGEWYRSLPAGLDTLLDTGGHSLSAGEGQLLAFTRVFLRRPGLVILDEASSRLDPATEQRIERAIARLLRGRTAIIIAHRLHTVHRADDILILEDGRACEYGSRTKLATDPQSRFYHLLQTGLEEVLA